ncbi:MAG: hypothetical protein H6843_15510 [Rhodospirillaceae bacterium]|nr:hypothetical protein [Rhodospirillaceae bacterium]
MSGAPKLAPATAVAAQEAGEKPGQQTVGQAGQASGSKTELTTAQGSADADASGLTEEQQAEVAALKERDAEVRRHEQAHAAAGGAYAGQPTYEYQTGPDGNRYAVGGEVDIDVAPVPDDPAATIRKMDVVIRAALAPEEPSPQDHRVAEQARATRDEARRDLNAEQAEALLPAEDRQAQAIAAYRAAGAAIGTPRPTASAVA